MPKGPITWTDDDLIAEIERLSADNKAMRSAIKDHIDSQPITNTDSPLYKLAYPGQSRQHEAPMAKKRQYVSLMGGELWLERKQ